MNELKKQFIFVIYTYRFEINSLNDKNGVCVLYL